MIKRSKAYNTEVSNTQKYNFCRNGCHNLANKISNQSIKQHQSADFNIVYCLLIFLTNYDYNQTLLILSEENFFNHVLVKQKKAHLEITSF